MIWRVAAIAIIALVNAGVAMAGEDAAGKAKCAEAVEPIHVELISQPSNPKKKVEFFWIKPTQPGKWPLLILIHGDQPLGGCKYVQDGYLQKFMKRGMAVASVSQPGYGGSDGPADFCGPFTQAAVRQVLSFFRQQEFVDATRIGLFGYSRGAIVAGMVAAQDPALRALIMGAGVYDLKAAYPKFDSDLQQAVDEEAGTTDEVYALRSPLLKVKEIKTPTLILHGQRDKLAPPAQASMMAEALRESGTPVQMMLYDSGHQIPAEEVSKAVDAFVEQYLMQ